MMKIKWFGVIILVIGIGTGAYFLRSMVSYYVITPIVLAVRIEQLLFNSLPQVVFWTLFLLVGLVLALNSSPFKRNFSSSPAQVGEKWESRARQFSKWIRTSEKSEYSKWMLDCQGF